MPGTNRYQLPSINQQKARPGLELKPQQGRTQFMRLPVGNMVPSLTTQACLVPEPTLLSPFFPHILWVAGGHTRP